MALLKKCAVMIFFLPVLLPAVAQVSNVEHPVTLVKFNDCSTCHAAKSSGKSVHSAMAVLCTVCHAAKTEGNVTTINLVAPKEKICFSCHEKSALLEQHSPAVRKLCVDCHDAHSSSRRMLLLAGSDIPPAQIRAASAERKRKLRADRSKPVPQYHPPR